MTNIYNDIVLFTGGFDPIHSGHIQCINECAEYGRVIIGLNSDEWLKRKKGKPFMPYEERYSIIKQFKHVLTVIDFDDSDNSACDAIIKTKNLFPKNKILFANGGDRTSTNIPEMTRFQDDPLVDFIFGIGGNYKKNSSSWILSEWKNFSEKRIWGNFTTYYDSKEAKVKRLIIEPGKSISMQYHNQRSEFWFIEKGIGKLTTLVQDKEVLIKKLEKHDIFNVNIGSWHKLYNIGKENLEVIEIQYGSLCVEEDIVRL